MQSERERIARFLNLEAGHPLQLARIRGIRSVETARKFLEFEADHQGRQFVVGAINRRVKELEAREDGPTPAEAASGGEGASAAVATDGGDETPLSAGEDCPECADGTLKVVAVHDQDGLWCPHCADFRGEAA
jgi:hypothetical protein